MKILFWLGIGVGVIAIGFLCQWIAWELVPMIKDKIKEKKNKKI